MIGKLLKVNFITEDAAIFMKTVFVFTNIANN